MTDISNLLDMKSEREGRVEGEPRFMAWLTGRTRKCEPMEGSGKCSQNSEAKETAVGKDVERVVSEGHCLQTSRVRGKDGSVEEYGALASEIHGFKSLLCH